MGRVIRPSNLVAFPTETVCGLGAEALNLLAVERILGAEGRPAGNPPIVHIAGPQDLETVAARFPEKPGSWRLASGQGRRR